MEWTGEAGVVSDGGRAAKAKSRQIHLLSPTISLRNWRQFVSFQWQQIWKHYVKKPLGKKAVLVVTMIYKCAKVIKKQKKKTTGPRQTLFRREDLDICFKIPIPTHTKSPFLGHLVTKLDSLSHATFTGVFSP